MNVGKDVTTLDRLEAWEKHLIAIKRTSKSLQEEEEEAERKIAIQCNRYKIVSGRLDICLMRQHNYLNKKSIQRNRGKRICA